MNVKAYRLAVRHLAFVLREVNALADESIDALDPACWDAVEVLCSVVAKRYRKTRHEVERDVYASINTDTYR